MCLHYREVYLTQNYFCTQLYVVQTADSVLCEEEPLFRMSAIERIVCMSTTVDGTVYVPAIYMYTVS